MLSEGHEAEAGEHVLLALRQQLLDNALLEERPRQAQLSSVEVTRQWREKVLDGAEGAALKFRLLDGVREERHVDEQQDAGRQQVRAAEKDDRPEKDFIQGLVFVCGHRPKTKELLEFLFTIWFISSLKGI